MWARKQSESRWGAMPKTRAPYRRKNLGLRSCHPRDILEQLTDTARFLGRPAQLTPDLIDMACEPYFGSLDPSGSPQGASPAARASFTRERLRGNTHHRRVNPC